MEISALKGEPTKVVIGHDNILREYVTVNRATVQGGLRILEKLESARCDMFRHRPVLKWHDWPLIMARAL